jgi:hypothetical protein
MKKHYLYLKYLLRHKYFVYLAGRVLGVSLWRLLIHDWTKLLPCEWFPYMNTFYGKSWQKIPHLHRNWEYAFDEHPTLPCAGDDHCPRCKAKIAADEAFNRAWLHHQKWNKHHWQYWVMPEDTPSNPSGNPKVLEIPERYAREMVADWIGAGRAITGSWDVRGWYSKNRDHIKLHPNTRISVSLSLAAFLIHARMSQSDSV